MKQRIKISLLICLLLMLMSSLFCYAATPTVLSVNGVQSESESKIIGGFTYVPLRSFFQIMDDDFQVTWDTASQSATVLCSGLKMQVFANGTYVMANDRYFYLPYGVYTEDGKIFLPIWVMAYFFGAEVGWSNGYETLYVTTVGSTLAPADTYYNKNDLYWLSRIISAESRGEPLKGKIAVGNVVLNRVQNSRYPSTIRDVIFDRKFGVQFSPVASGSIYNTPTQESIIAAKICLEGTNMVGDSLFFFNKSISTSRWIENNCDYVTTIGRHSFYK